MYELYCEYEQKDSVFTGINGSENCHCVRCGHIKPRPQPDQTGWTEDEQAIYAEIWRMECMDIPLVPARAKSRLEKYSIEEITAVFKKIGFLGE